MSEDVLAAAEWLKFAYGDGYAAFSPFNPFDPATEQALHAEWERGVADRAAGVSKVRTGEDAMPEMTMIERIAQTIVDALHGQQAHDGIFAHSPETLESVQLDGMFNMIEVAKAVLDSAALSR